MIYARRGLRPSRNHGNDEVMRNYALAWSGLALASALVGCNQEEPSTTLTGVTAATNPTNPSDPGTTSISGTTVAPDTDPSPPTTSGGTEATDSSTPTTDASTTLTTTTDPSTTTGGPGDCVEADCPMGQFCNADSGACEPGCNDDTDCMNGLVCDVGSHTCTGCLDNTNCAVGTVCKAGSCVPGCDAMQPCNDGLACCSEVCLDLLADPLHCGGCDIACPVPPNAAATCTMSTCGMGVCADGFNNCDGDTQNGCEVNGSCKCKPGEQAACYTGPDGTKDVGICKGGTQTCNAMGTGYDACTGQVLPGAIDICANGLDDDCDGVKDEDPDVDKDGWTVCGGDCCDVVGPDCLNPELVNPGAFEVMGNTVDDDCDAKVDNIVAACDNALATNSADPLAYAKAIDLCQFTVENPPALKDKKWGVISGLFSRSNGAGNPNANARSIRDGFGSAIAPKANKSLAALATGNAADLTDKSPAYSAFQGGTDMNADASVPTDWLNLNGNNFPNVVGCPEPQGGATGLDTIQLKLRIRVPTNAKSFSTKIYFFSSEYPEWVCSPYNDFFLTLVDSAGAGNPGDKNIAVYKDGNNALFPVGVNLVKTANGLFTQCKNGQTGCGGGAVLANYNGCVGNAELAGTGFDLLNPLPKFGGDPGYCGANNQVGGGTGWLKMSGNVKPGETMELRFVIWDTGDEWYDSVVLLDDFQWSVQASQPGVQPG